MWRKIDRHVAHPFGGPRLGRVIPFVKVIKQRSDAVINLTTDGHPSTTLAGRLRPATRFEPEIASLTMGTMGFGLFPMHTDIEDLLGLLSPLGTRFEFECYDTSRLYNLAHFLDRVLMKAPLLVQTCFGILGGIGSHPDDVVHMKRTADRVFDDKYAWSVLGARAPDERGSDGRGDGRQHPRRAYGRLT